MSFLSQVIELVQISSGFLLLMKVWLFSALMVYISLLEQQSKYKDALEVLSGNLGSLLVIEVDKLRIQVIYKAFLVGNISQLHAFLHYILRRAPKF